MINNKKIIAIIPARGGSKRLPRKNILSLEGKPLIAWTIEAALESAYIDRVFVSTDDLEIAEIAKKFGAEVPELRPKSLGLDSTTTMDVLSHVLHNYKNDEHYFVLLQPTSPLRTNKHIDEAIAMMATKDAKLVVSVTSCEHSPLWTNKLPSNGCMNNFLNKQSNLRSQELDSYYRLNGAIYVQDIQYFLKNRTINYDEYSYAYIMDTKSSVDIDNEIDFELAEFYLRKKK